MNENEVHPIPGWRGGDGNAAYLDKTLRHQPMDMYLDDTVGWRVIFSLWLRGAVASVLVWMAFWLLALLFILVSPEASFFFGITGNVVAIGVFVAIVLLSKLPEPIAEWRVVLPDRAEFVHSAYSQITGTVQRRQLPFGGGPRRIRTGAAPTDLSHRLFLTEGDFRVYVSVFSYGTSLYLGWQMWRSRRGAALIWQFLSGIVRSMLGHNDPEITMLRADRARAMREAVHAACREGLMVAVEGIQVPEQFGFPYGMPPVEEGQFASGPVPGGFAPPTADHGSAPGRHGLPQSP
ncbi:adhesin [Lentzea sp. NEAU-D13]|uniref:Adhesin n=1 Tax=Lentzea alba TaxID=2714351 RepID=A0A7C9RYR3_9PSEU|nr:adhesin [Lentzea alba]NGY65326.1 adhesin [Lentzea alba]